jgi:glycosyltransferase involved in cell wall biosynthesis
MFPGNRKNDLSQIEFKRKIRLFSDFKNISFISPSNWLYDCAIQSKLTAGKPVYYIPNIIDDKLFKPFEKDVAKRILNIDPDSRVISFGAASVNSPYKGWSYLMSALELLKNRIDDKNILILIFGGYYNKNIADSIPFKTRFIGRLRDDYSTLLIYNASDVFVAPSLAESFGYVILESLACGTPVAGFNIGGIPDLIKHKENGYLARYKDADDLATGVKYCLESRISGSVLATLKPEKVVKTHLDLINKLCTEK